MGKLMFYQVTAFTKSFFQECSCRGSKTMCGSNISLSLSLSLSLSTAPLRSMNTISKTTKILLENEKSE